MARKKTPPATEPETPEKINADALDESVPEPAPFQPYRAAVIPPLLVVRKEPGGTVVGTLARNATVKVTASEDGYAQMDNGLFVREDLLKRL